MKVGEKLENGAIVICYARNDRTGEWYVLAYKEDNNEYVTWFVNEKGDTYHGHYFWNRDLITGLGDALWDLNVRIGKTKIMETEEV